MFFIFWYDYLLLPIYLIAVYAYLQFYFKRKHGHNPSLKKHFNRGLLLKLFGCVLIGLTYEHYYRGAFDGRFYFEGGKVLTQYWLKFPTSFFPVLIGDLQTFNQTNTMGLNMANVNIFAEASFFVSKVVAIFNVVSFNAFLPCSLFFCAFAFVGLWKFFIFLIEEQGISKQHAGFCTIYIPSLMVWDSSIFKDTITFTALCWMFICGYYLFIKPKKVIVNLLGFAFSTFLVSQIKVYILAAFFPFFILYIFNSYKDKIKNPTLRMLSTPFIIVFSIGGILLFLQNAGELLGRYSVDQVLETAARTAYDIGALNAGSAYSINVDLSSTAGLLTAVPLGINVTLFRPYPWEYLKPIILFASAESMIILYFTIKIIRSLGFGKTFQTISAVPILQFCLLFSLLFAFMVGISSTNFGTLVRYKIPVLPFYTLFLAVLYKHSPLYRTQTSASKTKPPRRGITQIQPILPR